MSAPKSVKALVKSTVCEKNEFPYGVNKHNTFYNPNCLEGMLGCKDICGNKCLKQCKQEKPHPESCKRGKLSNNFMFCPKAVNGGVLNYVKYDLVEDPNIKEGKKVYKKTDKIETEMEMPDFVAKFIDDYPGFCKHTLEAWFLNAIKNAGFSNANQPSHALVCVSDFAQNLLVEKKHEVAEEYFHKSQIALFATVSTICNEIFDDQPGERVQHTLSQVTSSMNKYAYINYKFLLIFYPRTKDSSWVFGSLDHSVPEALAYASDHGQEIQLVVHAVKFKI